MQGITHRILEILPDLQRHNEGHWHEAYIDVAGGGTVGYSSFNDAGVECEVGEFLYGLVRLLKPEHILETGTHHGVGALYMGLGLCDNFSGHLDTFEFLPENHAIAARHIQDAGLNRFVKCHFGDVGQFIPEHRYNLMFLDTEPQTRFNELVRFYDFLYDGGYIFIHDLHRHMGQVENTEHGYAWPWGKLPQAIKDWVNTGKLRPFHFANPRGLTGFYKVNNDDYGWKPAI